MGRWRRNAVVLAAAVAVSTTACSGASAPASGPATDTAPQSRTSGARDGYELPDGPVQAAIAVTSDGVWAIGGSAGRSQAWEANPLAVHYRSDGAPDRSERLPIDADEIAEVTSTTLIDDGLVVAVTVCQLNATAENSPCVRPGDPHLWILDDDGVRSLPLDEQLTTPLRDDPAHGYLSVAGSVKGQVLVLRSLGDGPVPSFTTRVGAWLVDPASGEATLVTIPDGIASTGSVCAAGDRIYAVVPHVANGAVRGATLLRTSPGWSAPLVLAEIETEEQVVGGGLTCLEEVLVVEATGAPSTTFSVFERSTGTAVGTPLTVDAWGTSLLPAGDHRSLVVTNSPESGAAWMIDRTGAHPAGHFGRSPDPLGVRGAQIEGTIVDISKVGTNPSDTGPFPPINQS